MYVGTYECKYVYIVIVILNSRFLERPQKRSRGNQLIHMRLSNTKSIGSGSDPESQAGRQAGRQTYIYMNVCMYMYVCKHIHTYYVCMHEYMYACMCMCGHVYMHVGVVDHLYKVSLCSLTSAYFSAPLAQSVGIVRPGNSVRYTSTTQPRVLTASSCSCDYDYCIVLYLYIYIALLAVHTNQKRFQCERPREKRAVLRERKEALGSPVNKVDRVEGRSWFQSCKWL